MEGGKKHTHLDTELLLSIMVKDEIMSMLVKRFQSKSPRQYRQRAGQTRRQKMLTSTRVRLISQGCRCLVPDSVDLPSLIDPRALRFTYIGGPSSAMRITAVASVLHPKPQIPHGTIGHDVGYGGVSINHIAWLLSTRVDFSWLPWVPVRLV